MSTAEYRVHRHQSGGSSGCLGTVSYEPLDGQRHVGTYVGLSVEDILGRHVGAGTRVRVTVEVLEEVPAPDRCWLAGHPWGRTAHEDHAPNPDLIDANGDRWYWSEPDGLGGSRSLQMTRYQTGEPYTESGYSAGYRRVGEGPEIAPTRSSTIRRDYGPVEEVVPGE